MYQKKYTVHAGNLNEMLNFIMSILDSLSIKSEIKKKIYIISEEALTNIIKHAYTLDTFTQKEKILFIRIDTINNADLVIFFQDQGIEYDFDKIKKGNLKEKDNRGIGVFLIKKLADKVEYFRNKNLNNLKIIIKNVI